MLIPCNKKWFSRNLHNLPVKSIHKTNLFAPRRFLGSWRWRFLWILHKLDNISFLSQSWVLKCLVTTLEVDDSGETLEICYVSGLSYFGWKAKNCMIHYSNKLCNFLQLCNIILCWRLWTLFKMKTNWSDTYIDIIWVKYL